MSHTSTPWNHGNSSKGRIFKKWGIFAGGKRIADVAGGPDVANAAFIVTACNSHEALVAVVKSAVCWFGELGNDDGAQGLLDDLRAALALAEKEVTS